MGNCFFLEKVLAIFLSRSWSFKNSLKACGYLSQDLPRDAHHLGSISKLQKRRRTQPTNAPQPFPIPPKEKRVGPSSSRRTIFFLLPCMKTI